MSASLWNIPNWFNWYWWGLDDLEKADKNEVSDTSESLVENEEPKLEIKQPSSRRKIYRKKKVQKKGESINLFLKPTVLEKLEREAQETDSTLNKLIQIILESHINSKENHIESTNNIIETESWKCNFCNPEEEFSDYFKFSEHFFSQHMEPGLEKLSNSNQEQPKEES